MSERLLLLLGLARTGWRAVAPVVLLSLPLLIALWLGATGSLLLERQITGMLVNMILVVGLYVFMGNSGVFSFGHVAFMALGAYASGLLTIPVIQKSATMPDLPGFLAGAEFASLPAILIAGTFAATVALVVAVPFMRLNGIAAGIATFAWLIVVRTILSNWDSITRGDQQIIVPVNTELITAFFWAVAAIAGAYAFQQSAWGLRLRASREDLPAAKALGVSVSFERGRAFVISAFIVGLGGALYGHLHGAFSPQSFFLDTTFLIIAMLVIGGITTLTGAVLGTIVVTVISEFLLQAEQGVGVFGWTFTAPVGLRDIALGSILLLIIIVRPSGLTGGREVRWPLRRRGMPKASGRPALADARDPT